MSKKEVNILAKGNPKAVTLSDGKEYIFPSVNLNTLANIEEVLGYPLEQLKDKMKTGSMQTMRAMIYALLKENHPDLTLEKTGSLITMKEMSEVSEIISTIMGSE